MTYNSKDNNGYGKTHDKKNNLPSGKGAYEIRADLLKLALELELNNSNGKGENLSATKVVATAAVFNDFISKKNES
jgi:hypothetical protein